MKAKRLILTLSAAALGGLLILPTSASAKGPRGCGHWGCGHGTSCQTNRWQTPPRLSLTIYSSAYGTHAIRGWQAPYRVVEIRRGPGVFDRGRHGHGGFR
jgi:hypothetical protein